MKFLTICLLLLTSLSLNAQAKYRHEGKVLLNDMKATPGAISDVTTKQLCDKSFHTSSVRNVTSAQKKAVYASYGATPKKNVCCEVDHLISLELGGSNDTKNLWPQPYSPAPGAHEKDKLENWLHKQVCDGSMSLQDAQKKISTDWYAAYKEMQKQR